MKVNIPERAFQIAATGRCRNVTEIIEVLKREGYASAASYFAGGRSLRNELRKVIAESAVEGRKAAQTVGDTADAARSQP